MPDPKPITDNSESSQTPTRLQLDAERAELQERRRVLQALPGHGPPVEVALTEARRAQHVIAEATRALARAEVVLDIAVDVMRAHTEQLVIANKIAARKLHLEKQEADQEQDESRRVDKVLDASLALVQKVATDSRVWTAILTTVGWFVLQLLTGAHVPAPPVGP